MSSLPLIFKISCILFLGLIVSLTFANLPDFSTFSIQAETTNTIEAENSTLSSKTLVVDDAEASGSKFVRLGPNISSGGNTGGGSTVTGTSYFVDCSAGNDSNNGTSESTAWRTLSKASSANLQPGDGLFLKHGCLFDNQSLLASWSGTENSPILISSYGSGPTPTIQNNESGTRLVNITGSYLIVENIFARAVPPRYEAGCDNNPVGYIIGFQLDSSAHHNIVRNSSATGAYAGVYIRTGSHHNQIVDNTFNDNTMMNPLDVGGSGDAGAFGVLIHGDDNLVSRNTVSGQDACSYDYDRDGSVVEIYGGSRNTISYNVGTESDHFSELGKNSSQSSSDNVFAYNTFVSTLRDSVFLNTRGNGSNYGPIYNTLVYNNSTYLTGSESQGVVCSGCGPDILTLRNNILWADWKSIYASASFNESHNIYWSSDGSPFVQGFSIASSSREVNPLYVSLSPADLHVQASSPAKNAGSAESLTSGFTTDLDNNTVTNPPTIGAYQ